MRCPSSGRPRRAERLLRDDAVVTSTASVMCHYLANLDDASHAQQIAEGPE